MTNTLDHWSRYWQTGHLTSLPEDFAAVYDGEIEAFWSGIAKELPEGAQVLDVCAGNGPVALLMARHAPQAQLWAADAAAIDPAPALAGHPDLADLAQRVTFLPGTPAESVDGLGQCFDLVTSQYGLEYTDWSDSARAIVAALKPAGRLALVAHVPTSAMVATMDAEQREYALLGQSGALPALRKLGETGTPAARKRLKRALLPLRSPSASSALIGSFVQGMGALLAMEPAQLAEQQPAIRQYAADLAAGRDRAADLLDTNRRILAQPRWFEAFVEAGLELVSETEILYQGRHRSGLGLVFRKP